MLTLKRKVGERIWIGSKICITISEIHKKHIVLMFDVPDDITVLRGEIFAAFTHEERESTSRTAMRKRIAKHKRQEE